MHDALGARVEIDLDRVADHVAEEARLVALVRGGVVEAALREREDRERRPRGDGQLREQREGEHAHGGSREG